jgi:PAS domain S-box-containing protein
MSNASRPEVARPIDLLVASIRDYAIYMLNPEGIVISWNAGAERFKGYTAAEIVGQHFSRFHTPEDQAAGVPAQALATALATGKFECEGWRVRNDGTRFWASVVIDPVVTAEGQLAGFAKITRDMTDKKAAADALYASEQQFRLLVQGVLDYAIYMLSPEGVVTNWNSGARRIKGYEATEIIGSHFSTFYTAEERAKALPDQALAEATASGRYEAEGRRVRKDGSVFWAHVIIDAIRSDHGELLGFAKITRDVTDRKNAEKSLEQARAELFQSQKMEAMGQLTGGIAHDFNNLLSIVSSAVQILSHQSMSAQQVSVIETIQRAVDRGSTLTQQLLAFARQQPLAPEKHLINDIIERFEPMLRRAVTSSITFRTTLANDAGWLNIDEARFEAALLNLVVNSRDAMPHGGTLEITTARVELQRASSAALPAGAYVRISVTDSGSGMDEGVRARVFEPFYTTKEVGKGTGLGLSQVQGFIGQSGGHVSIESAPGRGTSVHMLLPAVAAPAQHAASIAASSELVIIAEDEPELAGLAKSLFETLGYVALVAHNGQDALRLLAQHPDADVLFSDVMMPGMTGLKLAHSARDLYPNLKIILASGYAAPALREQGNIDAFAFVAKPYRLSEIVRKLR